MTIEAADYVGELDNSLPTDDNDFVFEGDDHFRLIKSTLINSFANVLGAVLPTHTELNSLVGITGVVEDRLDALESIDNIPAGSKMVFIQNAAPVGWTFDATLNDQVLRTTSTEANGGMTGGDWIISGVTVDDHILTVPEIPPHVHDYLRTIVTVNTSETGSAGVQQISFPSTATSSTGGGSGHDHGLTSDGLWRPAYVDVIACTKD